jgi:hypothetical protein
MQARRRVRTRKLGEWYVECAYRTQTDDAQVPIADEPDLVAIIAQYEVGVRALARRIEAYRPVGPVFGKAIGQRSRHGRARSLKFLDPDVQAILKRDHVVDSQALRASYDRPIAADSSEMT